MTVFVIIEHTMPDEENEGGATILGVFDDKELAEDKIKELSLNADPTKCFYEALEYEMNVLMQESNENVISEAIESLIKRDLIDYTIGEDGEFYFHLTEKGRDVVDKQTGFEEDVD